MIPQESRRSGFLRDFCLPPRYFLYPAGNTFIIRRRGRGAAGGRPAYDRKERTQMGREEGWKTH